MAVVIVDIDDISFSINGIPYIKNFISLVNNDSVKIVNVYDSKIVLQQNTNFANYTVDGNSFGSAALLQSSLVQILFNRDLQGFENRISNLEQNQLTGVLYFSTKADMLAADATGQLNVAYKVISDITTSNNGDYTSDGATYTQQTFAVNGVVEVGNVDAVSGDTVNKFTLDKRRETQFQVFNQSNSSGEIDIVYDVSDNAVITLTGDLLLNITYDIDGVDTTNLFSRFVQVGTKVITVPTNRALFLDIIDALDSDGGIIPDSAYTMTANIADGVMLDEFPTDKILLFNNWNGVFKGANGLFKDYVVGKYSQENKDAIVDLSTKENVLNKRLEADIRIIKNNTVSSIVISYDTTGNATIDMNEELILFTARKDPVDTFSYTRLLLSAATKQITVNKGENLYFDVSKIISNATGDQIPNDTYIIQSALNAQVEGTILAFSNWFGEFDQHEGILANFESSDLVNVEKVIFDTSRTKTIPPLNYHKIHERIKPFIQNFLNESKDIEIVLLGDSILGRTVNNTQFSTAIQQSNPPMLISKNIASGIWDKVNNGSIQHSRWDKPSVFTEVGASWTSYFGETLKGAWDDAGDRAGETREFLGTASASTAFDFIAENRRLNFIYRTSTEGNANLTVSITLGNGKIEVYNGASWVEANGFSLSQFYVDLGTGYGNTEYQRRLKFRKAVAEVSNLHEITISKPITGGAESLMYWGVEQTNRDFIVSVRNTARGGHDMNQLWQTIRTEFDNFDTDLVLFELPIINMKNNTPEILPTGFWDNATYGVNDKLLGAGANSLKTISSSFVDFQVVPMLLNETLAWINTDGSLKDFEFSGSIYNSDSYFNYLSSKFWEFDNEIAFINVWRWFKINSNETFGDLYTSVINTDKESETSYSHNSHPNDYGVENLLNYINPIFDVNIS